ncbi:MAG: hypothetical protein ACOX6V_03990 [Patescibacteria group bacterium]|jgi:hypothetical protein
MTITERAVVATLLYADLFNFPLLLPEVHRKLQTSSNTTLSQVLKALNNLVKAKIIFQKGGYYFLPGRSETVVLRKKRMEIYKKKFQKLKNLLVFLTSCPWVVGIFLTGSLAAANSSDEDDIDLLIITSRNRLWLARLWLILQTEFMGLRIHKTTTCQKDKLCLNVFLEEDALRLPKSKRNLYTAHEILHAQAVFARNNCEKRFKEKNKWVLNFLPQAFNSKDMEKRSMLRIQKQEITTIDVVSKVSLPRVLSSIFTFFGDICNIASYYLQFWYKRRKLSSQDILRNQAFLHESNLSEKVLNVFSARKKSFRLI